VKLDSVMEAGVMLAMESFASSAVEGRTRGMAWLRWLSAAIRPAAG
jgi:hypothetical protein